MHLFYLHGFASGARSSKATFFRERLARVGIALHTPDFNEPDFATLTAPRMLTHRDAAMAALPPGPVAWIGSSLGSFVAWHAAARRAQHAEAADDADATNRASAANRGNGADARTHPIVALVLLAP